MNREEFNTRINELLLAARSLIPNDYPPDLPFMQLAPTVHDWYDFEHRIWGIGEDIRQLTVTENKHLSAEHTDLICEICLDRRAKRGRQSFIMLLGKKRYSHYADKIAPLVSDDDVCGHVINTLYKMGAYQYADMVKPYTSHSITWIRNEAKRYIKG